MIKKIKLLTNIFLKDYYQNLNIINKNNKLNKKSIFTWLIIILIFALAYVSLHVIILLQKIGIPVLFIKVYLPIIAILMIIQAISLVCRIFYYSKDLEYIMPLPIKTSEILIAKLNTVTIIMYFLEALYLLVPLLIYGILEVKSIIFFISIIITLLIFPILFITIISIMMLFIMKLSKLIKNQDLFQLIVVSAVTFIIMFGGLGFIEKIIFEPSPENLNRMQIIEMKTDKINKSFLVIEPIIEILENNNFLIKIKNFIKIIIINFVAIMIFILCGKKLYLKNILQNKNNIKKVKIKNKYKIKNKKIQYIKKDIKKIIKNPSYFLQNVFQQLCIVIVCIILINIFLPLYIQEIKNINMIENMAIDDFKFQAIMIVVGLLQLIFTFSNLSITAISREGKNAVFIKYIPISLYEQLKIKAFPQIFLNTIVIIMILTTIFIKVPEITFIYYILSFIIAMILNIINSYIMLLIDLKRPNLNWTNEESISKNNGNKLFQYVSTIFICLVLKYFSSICEGQNFIMSISLVITLFIIVLILLKIYMKKHINKLFNKIY